MAIKPNHVSLFAIYIYMCVVFKTNSKMAMAASFE